MAKGTKSYADAALTLGVTPEKLAHMNWGTFALNNLVPVTLGNIVGGGIFVAAVYWFIYLKKNNIADVHRNRKAI